LSQSSLQSAGVTKSPNQRWASSWARTIDRKRRSSMVGSRRWRRMSRATVISPGFSMAPLKKGTAIRSTLGNGTGRPT
jgi:hypothetical protein